MSPESHKAHLVHGLKTGIAAVLAFVAADILQLKFGYWAALSAVIVMQVNVADSVRMCWYRLSGTAVGAAMGMLCIVIFPETPVMIQLSLFISVAFCAYMTKYNTRYRMAAITVSIVLLASIGQPDRLSFALFRFVEIGVGVTCAFIVSITILPLRGGTALRERLRDHFAACADMYGNLMDRFLSMQSHLSPYIMEPLHNAIIEDRKLCQNVLHHERFIYHENAMLLEHKINTLEKCSSHLQAMLHALNDHEGSGYSILMEEELRNVATVTMKVMHAIASNETPDCAELETALTAAEDTLTKLRNDGATRRFYLQKLVQFFTFYHAAHGMSKDVLRYCTKLASANTELKK